MTNRYYLDVVTGNDKCILVGMVYDSVDGCVKLYLGNINTGEIVERTLDQVKITIK